MTKWATCPACDGAGEITVNRSIPRDPRLDRGERCRNCGGTGCVPAQSGASADLQETFNEGTTL